MRAGSGDEIEWRSRQRAVRERLLKWKTLDNNDLNQVESAVRAVSRGLSHKNALEADQNGGLSLGCYDLLLSTIDSVFSLENVLKNVFKNFNRVSEQEECFWNKISSFYCTNTCLLSCFGYSHCY